MQSGWILVLRGQIRFWCYPRSRPELHWSDDQRQRTLRWDRRVGIRRVQE